MGVTGIIVEYNPMHNGHCYHIAKTRETTGAEAVVAVMSGHFLQRGEPAIINKWARTEMALHNGVDLVLELPVVYATQSARSFAFASVATLDAIGIVDSLCFGSEEGNLLALKKISELVANPPFLLQKLQGEEVNKGTSYPQGMANALKRYLDHMGDKDAHLVDHPNNMLGIEYIRSLIQLKSRIQAFTIQRIAASYRERTFNHPAIASATAIRRSVLEKGLSTAFSFIPETNRFILKREFDEGRGPVDWESLARPLFALLLRTQEKDLTAYLHIDEGLAERLRFAATKTDQVAALIRSVKTRRYTWTRIQRALTSLYLGMTKEHAQHLMLEKGPTYIRVLGFNETGRKLLKDAARYSRLPIYTKISRDIPEMMEWDLMASRLYALAYKHPRNGRVDQEFTHPVMYVQGDS